MLILQRCVILLYFNLQWQESEGVYKDAVAHCNDCQYQVLEMAQKSILCAFRRIVIGFDTALKSVSYSLSHMYV